MGLKLPIVQGVTQVKFTTDEALLNEIRQDPLLTAYSVVVVDEVHERSLSTDLLLALLRKVPLFTPLILHWRCYWPLMLNVLI